MPPPRPLPPPPIPGTPVQYFPSTTVLIRRNLIGSCTTDPTTHQQLCTYSHAWHHYFKIGLLTGILTTLTILTILYLIYTHRAFLLRKLGFAILMSTPAGPALKTADIAFNTLEKTTGIDGKAIAKRAARKAAFKVKGGVKGGMKGSMKARVHKGHYGQQQRQGSKRQRQKQGETWYGPPLPSSPSQTETPSSQPIYLSSSYGHQDVEEKGFSYTQPICTLSLSSKPPSYRQHFFEAPATDGKPF